MVIEIREVWNHNLEQEFSMIRDIVDYYPYIAMKFEFPSIVIPPPLGNFDNVSDYNYHSLRNKVHMSKIIQLGLTFSNEVGDFRVWQFNFKGFDVTNDVYDTNSIELMRQRGINFERNNEMGIDSNRFGELLMHNSIVLNDNIKWVTFRGGNDFGHVIKLLTQRDLPNSLSDFFTLIKMYFPEVYDLKHLMRFCNGLECELNELGEILEVERVGGTHQVGSDSLFIGCCFMKLKDIFFNGGIERYGGVLIGLGIVGG